VTRALLALLLAACSDDAVELSPVFELPADDDAVPTGLDNLVLSVARAGSEDDLASRSFAPGERVELALVPFDDDLVVHLSGQARGSQVAYGRTCTFAVRADGDAPRPHLWFARNVKFASLALAPAPHAGGVAIEYAGGALLLAGGDDAIEHFDPRTGELAAIGSAATREGAAVAPSGLGGAQRIAVIGGDGAGFVELVDPSGGTARVERFDDARLARTAMTATALTDGRIVVIGGRANGAPTTDLFELATTGEVRALRATLATPRADHTATRLGDDVGAPVLVVGGTDAAGAPVAVAELFKPLSGDLANPATFAPAMIVPRRGHRAELMPDGSVLVIGGVDATGQPVLTLERFVIDAGFVSSGELPPNAGVVDITTTRLPDGRILIAGGRATPGGAAVDTAVIARLDIVNGAVDVVQTDRLAAARAGHIAVPLCDGTVWISGGERPIAERYNPPPTGRR
jgi:hypothetical protein